MGSDPLDAGQLADVLAELRHRRGAGARRLAVPVPVAAAWALKTNNPVPPGLNCLRFRDK